MNGQGTLFLNIGSTTIIPGMSAMIGFNVTWFQHLFIVFSITWVVFRNVKLPAVYISTKLPTFTLINSTRIDEGGLIIMSGIPSFQQNIIACTFLKDLYLSTIFICNPLFVSLILNNQLNSSWILLSVEIVELPLKNRNWLP